MWNECNCMVVWAFFGFAFFGGIGIKTDLVQPGGSQLNPSSTSPNCVTWVSHCLNLLLLVCKTSSIILRRVLCVWGSIELSLAASTSGYKTGRSFEEPPLSCFTSTVNSGVYTWLCLHALLRQNIRCSQSTNAGHVSAHWQPAVAWDTLSCFCLRKHGLNKQLAHPA